MDLPKAIEFPKLIFVYILTIQNDQHPMQSMFSPLLCVFRTIWVLGGGVPRGLGHNLLMQFSSLGSSKMEISETDVFDTLTIQNDHISYVQYVLAPPPFFCVFHTILVWGGGVAPKGFGAQLAYAVFQPRPLKNGRPSPLFEVPCRRQ